MTPDTIHLEPIPDAPPVPDRTHNTTRSVWVLVAVVAVAAFVVLLAQAAGAQVPNAAPTSAGLPGAPLVTKMLGWLRWGGLAGALASILVGAGIWGLSTTSGNGMYGTKGKTLLVGGLVGGALCGLAPALVNAMYAG